MLRDVRMQVPLRVYSQDGSLIGEFGEKRRAPVLIDEVPEQLIQAFIAAEDDRFFSHPGVDWQGLVRAAVSLIRTGEEKTGRQHHHHAGCPQFFPVPGKDLHEKTERNLPGDKDRKGTDQE